MPMPEPQGTIPPATVSSPPAIPLTDLAVLPAHRHIAIRYGGTLLALAVAAVLTEMFAPSLTRTIFIIFWPVVIGAAWFGGIGPAVMASVLSVVTVDYLLIPPLHGFGLTSSEDIFPFIVFLLVTVAIGYLMDAARRSQSTVAQLALENGRYARELDASAQEMSRQLEEAQAMSEELEQSAEELEERSEIAAAAEHFSRSIVESISDPFVVLDGDWRFQYINEAAEAVFARAGHEDMTGRVVWEAYPQLVGSDFEKHMRRASEGGVSVSFEAYYADTSEWSVTYCYPLPNGGIAAQWRNISERKRTEEAAHYLAQSTVTLASSLDYEDTLARLASLLVPQLGDWCAVHLRERNVLQQVAVAHIDPAKIEFAREINAKYPTPDESPTGVPNVIRTGKPELYSDIPPEMLEASAVDEEHLRITRELNIKSAIIAPLVTNNEVIGAITLIAAESGRRYTEADLPLVMEIARRAALAVENARHHRSALEARSRAEAMQQEAETANVAKTQFLTSMSHELRTPLNAIAGYADLMSLGIHGPITDAQSDDLERIKRNQRHLLGIINDILNFARLDAGRVEFNIINIPAYDVIDDLHPMIRPQVAGKDLQYRCDAIDRDIQVRADGEKLRQVLLNLLSNAIKFTLPGGSISMECHADSNVVEFIVKDTGIGIPREKLSTVFEPFVQISRSLAQPVEGTGLGLAISRDMVEGMGGSLTVSSEVGKGSTFTVSLPRAQ